MPTGYTADLMEKGQTFSEFVMLCSRNFGALIAMRDEPMNAEIPEFKPDSYYRESLEEAREELEEYLSLTADQRLALAARLKSEKLASLRETIRTDQEQNARLEEMRSQVLLWNPPTPDHQGLKRFMLEQLDTSVHNLDYWREKLKQIDDTPSFTFLDNREKDLRRSLFYCETALEEEIERVASRNAWVKALRESLATSGGEA